MEADMHWKVIAGALTFERRIYMPEALWNQVISLFHDNPESGDFGVLRTVALVAKALYWLGLDTTVWKSVAGCEVCHQIKAPRRPRYGATMPLPPLCNSWDGITMDFVTHVMNSTRLGYTGIVITFDLITKAANDRS